MERCSHRSKGIEYPRRQSTGQEKRRLAQYYEQDALRMRPICRASVLLPQAIVLAQVWDGPIAYQTETRISRALAVRAAALLLEPRHGRLTRTGWLLE
jgi:hypothetical protein